MLVTEKLQNYVNIYKISVRYQVKTLISHKTGSKTSQTGQTSLKRRINFTNGANFSNGANITQTPHKLLKRGKHHSNAA
ncbi:hypothetical protein QT711_09885 [Sporosarcina saromensis]|uniref:Uncharacterized protein n=1 Tax=Sporosarcina saromensis TaxID=359365 RepID=A0ABU4GD46_9BACL|nr:hypothetical protein [Sporosarcina saromensis]MDW0113497.1 hypothetical protein [Sporosarcina saromensis]